VGSEGGGGEAKGVGRDKGGGSNDGKTSVGYVRGLRESKSGEEMEVMLVGFRMRNGFRERMVMWLKVCGYHGKKAGEGLIWGGGQEERCRGRQTSARHCNNPIVRLLGNRQRYSFPRVSKSSCL